VRTLTRLGYGVDTAANGRQAIERFRGHAYDAVLSDLAMPDMEISAWAKDVVSIDVQ